MRVARSGGGNPSLTLSPVRDPPSGAAGMAPVRPMSARPARPGTPNVGGVLRPSSANAAAKGGALAKKKGAAGGVVSEDRYLTLEEEHRTLKRQLLEKDAKHKQLQTRLVRAEEAAKKAMLKAGAGKGGLSVAKQFDYEAENAELGNKLREAQRKIEAQHERVLHFKKQARDYKDKLQDALRLARAHRGARSGPGGGMGRRSQMIAVPAPTGPSADEAATAPVPGSASSDPEALSGEHVDLASAEAAKQFMALRNELEALREQNADLTMQLEDKGTAGAAEAEPADAHLPELERLRAEAVQLRRELGDARAAAAEATPLIEPRIVSGDAQLAAEVKSAWDKVSRLQARYDAAHGNLDQIKANHERVLDTLDETNRKLAVERKRSLELESKMRRLEVEAAGADDFKLMLEEARAEIVILSKENTQLLNSAMQAPTKAVEEARGLRARIAEQEKERADREIGYAKARMAAVEGRSAAPDAANLEIFKLQAELTVAQERIKMLENGATEAEKITAQLQKTSASPAKPSVSASPPPPPRPAAPELAPELYAAMGLPSDVPTLQAELVATRQEVTHLQGELAKARKMLVVQEEIAEEYRAEAEAAGAVVKGTAGGDKLIAADREIAKLRERCRKLEAQLVGAASDSTRTVRAGEDAVDEAAAPASAANDAQVLASCSAEETVMELALRYCELRPSSTVGARTSTFLTVDFYEHETQATAVQAGLSPEFNATLHYVCAADEFLARYMVEKQLVVELQRAAGQDFSRLGVAVVNMRQALRASAYGERAAGGAADITDANGVLIGQLHYSARLLRSLPEAAVAAAEARVADLILSGAEAAPGASAAGALVPAATAPTSAVRVIVERCVRLRPRPGAAGGEAAMRPYVSYTLPGVRRHDTALQRGADPLYNDARAVPTTREGAEAERLARGHLEVQVFDDAAPEDDLEAGVVGLCEVPLKDFVASGLPLSGAFPLRDRFGAPTGHVVLHVVWQDARSGEAVPALLRKQSGWGISPGGEGGALAAAEEAVAAVTAAAAAATAAPPALPAPPAQSNLPAGLPDPAVHVIMSVHRVSLGQAALAKLRDRRVFVLFEFLADYCDLSDQRTPSAEAAAEIAFDFTRAFNVDPAAHPEAAAALARMVRGVGSEAAISFSLVSESGAAGTQELAEVAYGEVSLAELAASGGDYVERELTLLGAEGERLGTASLTLIAYRALGAVTAQ